MNQNSNAHNQSQLSSEDERQLVQQLDAFEAALRKGESVEIESWLQRVPPRLRTALRDDLSRIHSELTGKDVADRGEGEGNRLTVAPTLPLPTPSPSSAELSRDHIGVAMGGSASLLNETTELLRIRLRAAALIVLGGVGMFFVRSLMFPERNLISVRMGVLVVAGWVIWRLRRGNKSPPLSSLRRLELLLLAAIAIHAIGLQLSGSILAASKDDPLALHVSMLFACGTWSVVNMSYAVLIPNTWRRASVMLIAAAATPLIVSWVAELLDPRITPMMLEKYRYAGALLTAVATGAAVASSYTMHRLRRQLATARRFGQYQLDRRLGRGGMGEVFLARHHLLKRPAAIKLIRPGLDTNEQVILRFEREVQATAALAHWNTVEIFDYGRTEDGAFYYVMEYLEGMSLQELVDQHGPLSPGRTVYLLEQVCQALAESHAAGLIHRDIKPANIFAARRGSQWDVAKLLDFGLVCEQTISNGDEEEKTSTRFEPLVGTPDYLSPEQACNIEVEPRSDIYSLGATAFFLLTGRPPFTEGRLTQRIAAHREQTPPSLGIEVPDALERVVMRCLAKRPSDRFESAAALRQALLACGVDSWTAEQAAQWWQENTSPRQP